MGHASYDTMAYAKIGDVLGHGRHNYAGIGLYADYGTSVEGLKLTGYLKGGAFSNHLNTQLVGQKVKFDNTGAYWGVHLGTHYDFQLSKLRSRTFVSYFYDGLQSSSYDVAGSEAIAGASFKFDSLTAHRVQIGSLFEYDHSATLRPYFGLTFEQVLSAEAKGTATDSKGSMTLRSSYLEGSTGIISAGWTYLNEAQTFEFEVGVNGYIGTRQGVSGQVQANWEF